MEQEGSVSAHDDEMITPRDHATNDELSPAWTTDGHIDDGTIEGWLDTAFSDEHATEIASHVGACAPCQARVAHARGFIAGASRVVRALDAVPAGVVSHDETVRAASRIIAAADATRTSGVAVASRRTRVWYTQAPARMAAALLVMVAGGSFMLARRSDRSVGEVIALSDSAPPVATRSRDAEAVVDEATPSKTPSDKARSTVMPGQKKDARAMETKERRDVALVQPTTADAASSTEKPQGVVSSLAVPVVAAAPTAVAAPAAPAPATVSNMPLNMVAKSSAATEQRQRRENASAANRLGEGAVGAARSASGLGAREADESVPSRCWMVQAAPTASAYRLPSALRLPETDVIGSHLVQWVGWPVDTSSTTVRMQVDADGRLVGESMNGAQRLELIVRRTAGEWQGTVTNTVDGKRATQRVQLKSASETMCKP